MLTLFLKFLALLMKPTLNANVWAGGAWYQEAVASILESGLKWQKLIGRSSPIWLQKLLRFCRRRRRSRVYHHTTNLVVLAEISSSCLTLRLLCSSCCRIALVASGTSFWARAASRRLIALIAQSENELVSLMIPVSNRHSDSLIGQFVADLLWQRIFGQPDSSLLQRGGAFVVPCLLALRLDTRKTFSVSFLC